MTANVPFCGQGRSNFFYVVELANGVHSRDKVLVSRRGGRKTRWARAPVANDAGRLQRQLRVLAPANLYSRFCVVALRPRILHVYPYSIDACRSLSNAPLPSLLWLQESKSDGVDAPRDSEPWRRA